MYDVAEKAGVSTATVSFAFRHPDKVKDDTKAKVLRVAEELGYVPSGNARSLAKGRTGTLGMYAFDMLLERPQGSNLEDDWPDVSPRSIDEPLDGDEPNVLVYPLYVDEVLRGFELECWKSGKGMLMGAGISGRSGIMSWTVFKLPQMTSMGLVMRLRTCLVVPCAMCPARAVVIPFSPSSNELPHAPCEWMSTYPGVITIPLALTI